MLSNSVFGWIAKVVGFNASFYGLAAEAVIGGAPYQFKMPETKLRNDGQSSESSDNNASA